MQAVGCGVVDSEFERLSVIRDLGLNGPPNNSGYDGIIKLCQEICQTPVALFSVVDEVRQFFKARVGMDLPHTPREVAFCDHAIRQQDLRSPLIVSDASRHPAFKRNPLVTGDGGIRFYMGLPVLAPRDLPVGTVCVIDHVPRLPTATMLQALSYARDAIERDIRLQLDAQTDELTGLYNRRKIEAVLDEEYRRARRADHPLAVLMIDIDHFKAINDAQGHLVGDEALAAVAACARGSLQRAGEAVGRWGGEEFLCVLPSVSQKAALLLADRLRRAIRDQVAVGDGHDRQRVTVSIGGASLAWCLEGDERSEAQLVEQADTALYAAKRAGRDRVTFFSELAAD